MQAAYITKTGSYQQIQVGDLPDPVIKPNEVLVKVQAVAVNHVDTFVRSGAFKTELSLPAVIGRDAVGTVQALGSAVTAFETGQLVWTNSMGYAGRPGVTSTLAAIPADRLFPVPVEVAPQQLIAAVHSAATAVILIKSVLKLHAGETVVIEGAAGHVGTKLVQVAHALGIQVLATMNRRDFDRVATLGSQQNYDYQGDFAAAMAQQYPQGVAGIIDTSGKVALQTNLNLLGLGGRIGLITAPTSNQFTFDVRQLYMQQQQIKGFVISHASLAQLQSAGTIVNQLMSQGRLLDDEYQVLPFSKAAQAHHWVETGHTKAKLILMPD